MIFWDFLMRRKPLLLGLIAVFAISGFLGGMISSRVQPELSTPSEPSTVPASDELFPDYEYIHLAVLNPDDPGATSTMPEPSEPSPEIEVPLTSVAPEDDLTEVKRLAAWYSIVYSTIFAFGLAVLVLAIARALLSFS